MEQQQVGDRKLFIAVITALCLRLIAVNEMNGLAFSLEIFLGFSLIVAKSMSSNTLIDSSGPSCGARSSKSCTNAKTRGQAKKRGQAKTRAQAKARAQAEMLLQKEIQFVGNRSFPNHDPESIGGRDVLERRLECQKTASVDNELPAHLARMCISDLLNSEEERALFRRMNYLKYRANAIRSSLNPRCPRSEDVRQVTQLISESERLRDHLVHSNIRLVISIVRKHVSRQFTFDELLSEGLAALVQAAEKFDYDRGFRFSTYAFRVVSRSLFRFMQIRKRDSARYYTSAEEAVLDRPGESGSNLEDSAMSDIRRKLYTLLQRLDRRERFILRCRYALGGHRKARTLQFIAQKLGVSKERVRQIEKRAIGKLSQMATGSLDNDVLLLDWLN